MWQYLVQTNVYLALDRKTHESYTILSPTFGNQSQCKEDNRLEWEDIYNQTPKTSNIQP